MNTSTEYVIPSHYLNRHDEVVYSSCKTTLQCDIGILTTGISAWSLTPKHPAQPTAYLALLPAPLVRYRELYWPLEGLNKTPTGVEWPEAPPTLAACVVVGNGECNALRYCSVARRRKVLETT